MPWKQLPPPLVPGLDVGDPFEAKRFFTTELLDLVRDVYGYVKRFMKKRGIDAPEKAIRFVIEKIDYPFNALGLPDDSHALFAFGGNFVAAVIADYWSADYETLMTFTINSKIGRNGYGDCEDVSILLCSMLQELGVECYVNLGLVYENEELLGGHGFVTANLPRYGWCLIETTLDRMPPYPDGFPKIDKDRNIYVVSDLSYVAMLRFNRSVYEEWRGMHEMGREARSRFEWYRIFTHQCKNRESKFRAIECAWGIPTKIKRAKTS